MYQTLKFSIRVSNFDSILSKIERNLYLNNEILNKHLTKTLKITKIKRKLSDADHTLIVHQVNRASWKR